jgi:hypothetical protein
VVPRAGRTGAAVLCGAGQREWAARVDPEPANLRAVADTALDIEDDEAVIELVWSFIVLYFIRDAVHEPESWMERVVEAGRPLGDLSKAKLGTLLTLMRIFRGEYTGARESLESSLGVFLAHGMDFEAAVALKELGWVRYVLDEDAQAAMTSLENRHVSSIASATIEVSIERRQPRVSMHSARLRLRVATRRQPHGP